MNHSEKKFEPMPYWNIRSELFNFNVNREFDNRFELFVDLMLQYFSILEKNNIAKKNYKFLEIGVWKASLVPHVKNKFGDMVAYEGVDPYGQLIDDPYKGFFWHSDKESEEVYQSSNNIFINNAAVLHRCSSKEFFDKNTELYDIIFVDGDHRYAGCKYDLEMALERLNPGGLIVCDDIGNNFHPEVEWAARDFINENKDSFCGIGAHPLFFRLDGMPLPVMLMLGCFMKKV